MTLTRSQRRNLDKLATYLEGLPKNYRHFEMAEYFNGPGGDAEVKYARENGGLGQCGAVACAVGHGPAAGVLLRLKETYRDWNGQLRADWCGYQGRFVSEDVDYSWAFCGGWTVTDNHHWGAAARIRYLLAHGRPPDGFGYPTPKWLAEYREFDKRHASVPA